jgi:hypothetical protein
MAKTPRPDGWKGGSEDFGLLRTFDGHISTDRTGSSSEADERFGYANVRQGFDEADLGGDYDTTIGKRETPDAHTGAS